MIDNRSLHDTSAKEVVLNIGFIWSGDESAEAFVKIVRFNEVIHILLENAIDLKLQQCLFSNKGSKIKAKGQKAIFETIRTKFRKIYTHKVISYHLISYRVAFFALGTI